MEFHRGERVTLDFDTGTVHKLDSEPEHQLPNPALPAFVGDVLERHSSSADPPIAPSLTTNVNGFPAHRKRVPRVSAFKQRLAAKEKAGAVPEVHNAPPHPRSTTGFDADAERKAIDEENQRTIAGMSDSQIEQERQELFENFSPALLQKLLMRSSIDAGSNERDLYPEKSQVPGPCVSDAVKAEAESKSPSTKKVSFAEPEQPGDVALQESESALSLAAPKQPLSHAEAVSMPTTDISSDSIHFPTPPQPPDLDPDDPDFLKNLHDKYFPNLPYNPSELSWMAPIDPSDKSSPYHPSQTALNASELRFDFKGMLLAPSVARAIPSTKGLHHHADAPEAAGYTIPELAVLSRSQVAAQRCMAYQTLGRVLYRLGQGEYGVERASQNTHGPVQIAKDPAVEGDEEGEEEDVGSAMASGLWDCIEEGRVIETMTEEANKTKGHLTARTFAQEALWNWRRGGGRKRHAV